MLCEHEVDIDPLPPRTRGCEECLENRYAPGFYLRLCLTCGHVGCCDSSPGRHATKHFHSHGSPGGRVVGAGRTVGLVLRRSGGDGRAGSKPCRTCGAETYGAALGRRLDHGRASTCGPSPFPSSTSPSWPRLDRCPLTKLAQYRDGEKLFKAGDRDFKFFVIKSGKVENVDESGDTPRTVAVQGPGEFTGDVAQLTGGPAIVNAIARGDCEVYEVSPEGPGISSSTTPPRAGRHHRAGVHRAPPTP